MSADLKTLQARVAEATSDDSDSYLFGDVMRALVPYTPSNSEVLKFQGRFYRMLDAGAWESAALALCARVGWRLYTLDMSVEGRPAAMMKGPVRHYPADDVSPAHDGPAWKLGTGNTPALALLSALLSALTQTPDSKERETDDR